MCAKKIKMPSKCDLKHRTSSISNAFAQAVTPYVKPTDDEINSMLDELGIEENQCAYCLAKVEQVQMDHLHPLVSNKMPTGHITHISNLVPSCGSCNGSKGNKEFVEWYDDPKTKAYLKKAKLSEDQIKERRDVILEYSKKSVSYGEGYETVLSEEEIQEYIQKRDAINNALIDAQDWFDEIKKKIESRLKANGGSLKTH